MDWAELQQWNARRSSGRRLFQPGLHEAPARLVPQTSSCGAPGSLLSPRRLPTMSYRDYGRDRSRSPARDYGRSSGGYGGGSR